MSHMRMKSLLVCLSALAFGFYAWGSFAANLVSRSQLRRTVDPSDRGPTGTVLMGIDANGKETFQVALKRLGEDNFGIFLANKSSFDTNCCVYSVDPLDRTSVKSGSWSRKLVGDGAAPQEFLNLSVFDLDIPDLTVLSNSEVDISQPGIPNLTTMVTNIIAGTTNVFFGVTNVVGTTTNIITGIEVPNPGQTGLVFSALWAPLSGLTAKPGRLSYHRHGTLSHVGTASPDARATVRISFTGSTGRSVLDIRAVKLTRGQTYTVFVSNATNSIPLIMIPVNVMTQKKDSSSARFLRDTKFADPLPQQARDIGDLSGRLIEIRDAFDVVHLEGVMP